MSGRSVNTISEQTANWMSVIVCHPLRLDQHGCTLAFDMQS